MRLAGWMLWTLAGGVGCFAACAFPEFAYDTASSSTNSDGGTGVTSTTGGQGGTGGSGGAAAMGGGGATTTAAGGQGGQGGGACEFGVVGECGAGMKCSIVDETLGVPDGVGCVTAGPRPKWARCINDTECQDGTYCDQYNRACQPVCNENGLTCDRVGSQCIEAWGKVEQPVVGASICTANCDPKTAAICDDTYGPVTCRIATNIGFDCAWTDNKSTWSACTGGGECTKGTVCIGSPMLCKPWCTPPDNGSMDCPTKQGATTYCVNTNPATSHMGTDYGVCIEP